MKPHKPIDFANRKTCITSTKKRNKIGANGHPSQIDKVLKRSTRDRQDKCIDFVNRKTCITSTKKRNKIGGMWKEGREIVR